MRTVASHNLCIVIFLFCLFLCSVDAAPRCLESSEIVDSDDCTYGIATDWCNEIVCAKGPGEECGGRYQEKGTCSSGLLCECNVCTGCSNYSIKCHKISVNCLYG